MLSKNKVRRTPTTPVPSQMSHHIDLGEPGKSLSAFFKESYCPGREGHLSLPISQTITPFLPFAEVRRDVKGMSHVRKSQTHMQSI